MNKNFFYKFIFSNYLIGDEGLIHLSNSIENLYYLRKLSLIFVSYDLYLQIKIKKKSIIIIINMFYCN